MDIKVCDALCGSGKTSACINMMNERDDVRFMFVTHYLSEVDRIKSACASRDFFSPEPKQGSSSTKLGDVNHLLERGLNIATTHSLFSSYTDRTKQLIQDQHYILVLDESVNIMTMSGIQPCDINILERSETVRSEDGRVLWNDEEYEKSIGGRFREEMLRAKSNNLIRLDDGYFFWTIPKELFTCFSEVYVLTYLFGGQDLRCFLEMHKLPWHYIGVKKDESGKYVFCEAREMNRCVDLRNKIHIVNREKINRIGNKNTALSVGWFRRAEEGGGELLEELKRNIENVFKNTFHARGDNFLWSTFKPYKDRLTGRGYGGAFIPYNISASNAYADRKYLAYCVNNFQRPWITRYYSDRGVKVNQPAFALSLLVQWVFRSAIRNGEEIWLYVPSKRMRFLLLEWLTRLAHGDDLMLDYVGNETHYRQIVREYAHGHEQPEQK